MGASKLYLQYNGPQNPTLIIKAPYMGALLNLENPGFQEGAHVAGMEAAQLFREAGRAGCFPFINTGSHKTLNPVMS